MNGSAPRVARLGGLALMEGRFELEGELAWHSNIVPFVGLKSLV
jgi:hypothetical protein